MCNTHGTPARAQWHGQLPGHAQLLIFLLFYFCIKRIHAKYTKTCTIRKFPTILWYSYRCFILVPCSLKLCTHARITVLPICLLTFQYNNAHFSVFYMQFPYFTMSSIYSICIRPSKFFSIFKILYVFVVKFQYKY